MPQHTRLIEYPFPECSKLGMSSRPPSLRHHGIADFDTETREDESGQHSGSKKDRQKKARMAL